jgi:hypothetical protein
VAFPQLGIQIVENLKAVDLAQLHLHLEQLFILSQLLNFLLSLLEPTIPLNLLINGVGPEIDDLGACIDHQQDRIVEFADDLGYFEMHSPIYFFLGRTEEKQFLVDAEVVLTPT